MNNKKFNMEEIHGDCKKLVREIQELQSKDKDKDMLIQRLK